MTKPHIPEAVLHELARTSLLFPAFHSAHEGWAVLREEEEELWEAIRQNDKPQIRAEAIQVAAMALRFLADCCDPPDGERP